MVDEDGDGAAVEPPELDYPNLNTVPPRPQLSYPVQQRRDIVEGLIADLENARYTGQVVRFRTGRSNLPPPPEPQRIPATVAEALIGPDRPAPAPKAVTVAPSAVIDDAPLYFGDIPDDDDGTLSDFVRQMERETAPQPVPPSLDPTLSSEPIEPAPGDAPPSGTEDDRTEDLTPGAGATPVATYVVPPEVPRADRVAGAAPAATYLVPPEMPRADRVADAAPAATYLVPPEVPRADRVAGAAPAAYVVPAAVSSADPAMARSVADPQSRTVPLPRLRPEPPTVAAANVFLPEPRPVPPAASTTEVALRAPSDPPDVSDAPAAPLQDASTSLVQAGLVGFAPGSADLAITAEPELARLLADAQRDGLLIDIIGEAEEPMLALDRAHAVALALIKLGAGAERLRIGADPEPSGDRAWIILADPL